MKRIILACILALASTVAVHAQSASETAATQNAKLAFNSKVSEWHAYLSRNQDELAQKSFTDVSGMMQSRISEENRDMGGAANDADKNALKSRIKTQQTLYTEIKMLSVDMKKNAGAIREKLNTFLQNY